jgi:hypothetical protein
MLVSVELPTASRLVVRLGEARVDLICERAGVGLDHFKLSEDMATPVAPTTVDAARQDPAGRGRREGRGARRGTRT